MFKSILALFRANSSSADPPRYVGQECFNCVHWDYCDPDDIDESDGYCGVNFVHDAHAEYGSWTAHDDWCREWKEVDAGELANRRSERASALRKAADAVDPSAADSGKPTTRV